MRTKLLQYIVANKREIVKNLKWRISIIF
jgi:hypothetical protein